MGATPSEDLTDGGVLHDGANRSGDVVQAPIEDTVEQALDLVPAPDGFPQPDSGECVPGAACALDLTEPCYEGRCNALGTCLATPITGCCEVDDDCTGLIPETACDVRLCIANACTLVTRPGCCTTTEMCADDEPCTANSCVGGAGGVCSSCPTDCECDDSSPLFEARFDDQALLSDGFGVNDQQFDAVTWRLSTRRAVSPPSAAWLGDLNCPTYYSGALGSDCQPAGAGATDGGPVSVELVGPATSLPASPGGYVASFWLWSDVEVLGSGGSSERDVLTVSVHDVLDGTTWPVASSLEVGKSTAGGWRQMAVDLSPWTGSTISLRFLFDTRDGQDNHHEGVYLDELIIFPRCASTCCEVDADCPVPDTSDTCFATTCVPLSSGANGTCLTGPTHPGDTCTACTSDLACDDENGCTTDLCGEDGTCSHVAFCCLEVTTYATSFEEGLLGWYVTDDQPDDGVTWTTHTTLATDGASAAWLGDPLSGTYATGGPVRASLQTPQIQMPPSADEYGEAAVRFSVHLSTEWDGQEYANLMGVDRLTLEVQSAGGPASEIWSSDDIGGSTGGSWQEIEVSLAPWSGQSVQLRFTFDTVDDSANDFSGPSVDDFRIGQVCP